ncbi:hypothetical protein ACO11K_003642 [Bacillus cytotoxicus]|uniref:hypothetical protein n=2 Tax=Bacillus TaxID=1386 RepID=UPI001F58BAF4|nr:MULTISPECIES: hypothetical protein [unclassified Bacillus cereus group]
MMGKFEFTINTLETALEHYLKTMEVINKNSKRYKQFEKRTKELKEALVILNRFNRKEEQDG